MNKRNPKRFPQRGDRFATVVTDRRGVEYVRSRTVVEVVRGGIYFSPRQVRQFATRSQWNSWLKDARFAGVNGKWLSEPRPRTVSRD